MAGHFSTAWAPSFNKYLEQRHKIIPSPSGYYIVGITDSRGYKKNSMIDFYSGAGQLKVSRFTIFQHCIDKSWTCAGSSLPMPMCRPSPAPWHTGKQFKQYQIYTRASSIVVTSGSSRRLISCAACPSKRQKDGPDWTAIYYGMIKSIYLCNTPTLNPPRFNGVDFEELERSVFIMGTSNFYTIPRYHNPQAIPIPGGKAGAAAPGRQIQCLHSRGWYRCWFWH